MLYLKGGDLLGVISEGRRTCWVLYLKGGGPVGCYI